ncbi:MAG: hypothetical protein PHP52_13880 [Bacteroidales bacterium]|nr:hypothetical protein [Bacteroidales bacterium]MDD4217918.1 hypothetical protein [Bacteroidales bacterium]MDY0143375.1 hypothetical protein [Bacteroidales bacterium]
MICFDLQLDTIKIILKFCFIITKNPIFTSMFNEDNKTVCAVSSPSGVEAIAIIRLSGSKSAEIAAKILNNPKRFLASDAGIVVNCKNKLELYQKQKPTNILKVEFINKGLPTK